MSNYRKSKVTRTCKRAKKRLGLTWRFRRAWLRDNIRKTDLRNAVDGN